MSQANLGSQAIGSVSPIWGPFRGPQHAASVLGAYIDQGVGHSVGICWAVHGDLYPLRHAIYDGGGFGETVVVEWATQAPSPPSGAHDSGFWNKVEGWFRTYLEIQGQFALQQADMERAQGRLLAGAFGTLADRAFRKHGTDTLGVALDVIAVGLTIGFASGALATIALAGGIVLLTADGVAWAMEMDDQDELAENTKHVTAIVRWAAIIASIPDAAIGLCAVAKELPESIRTAAELTKSSRATAFRASMDVARTEASAARAEDAAIRSGQAALSRKYAAVAERAQKRAADEALKLQQKIGMTAKHEVPPRLTVPPSLYLMTEDELDPHNDDIIARNIRKLNFHVVSAHR